MSKTTPPDPRIRFSPYAWAKLLFLRDSGPTEVSAFALTLADDPLYVADVEMVLHHATTVTVSLDDAAVADFFDAKVDAGMRPEQFGRIWIHTHPGDSPSPSMVDEETFSRVWGRCQWSVMFVLARGGKTYARLRFNSGPRADFALPVGVDFTRPFPASNQDAWKAEYAACVRQGAEVAWNTSSIEVDWTEADDAADQQGYNAPFCDACGEYVNPESLVPCPVCHEVMCVDCLKRGCGNCADLEMADWQDWRRTW